MTVLVDLDRASLTAPVRRALRRPTAEIGDWHCERLHGGEGTTSAGVYRVTGHALDDGEVVPWDLVLKIVAPPQAVPSASALPHDDTREPTSLFYWQREVLAYQSGLLDALPACLRAPECYGIVEDAHAGTWLWLETIVDQAPRRWSFAKFADAAQRLGGFNGAFLTQRSLPDVPWLNTNWIGGWVARAEPAMAQLAAIRTHPLIARIFPAPVAEGLLRLWSERGSLLAALERLPRVVCHNDAHRNNLLMHRTADGREQMVAIDWADVGRGPIGADLALLVPTVLDLLEVEIAHAPELDALVFAAYVEGLRDAGWHGDTQVVRFGYTATMALRYALGYLPYSVELALHEEEHAAVEQQFGAPIGELMERWGAVQRFLLDRASEAQQLLPHLAERETLCR